MKICVLRTGDAIPEVAVRRGEFGRWIAETVGEHWDGAWHEHDVRHEGAGALPVPTAFQAVVITGSSASVTERAPWMLRAEAYVREVHGAGVPLLGICFGHQLIAQALGGLVTRNPLGREIGTIQVRRHDGHDDPLFLGLPLEVEVNATHVDSVARLPEGARVLASSAQEPTAAFAVGETTRGLQFHPEIDGEVMRGYVRARAHLLKAEGLCPDTIHGRVHDAPHGREILRNFVRHVVRRRRHAA